MESLLGNSPSRSPPRRDLQGPRPAPLKVRQESHRIRKPPVIPPQPRRAPVIIYIVSPKVIHANPNEFMSLVQRLTGSDNTSYCSSPHNYFRDLSGGSGSMSPAARLASTEKVNYLERKNNKPILARDNDHDDAEMVGGIQISNEVERIGHFPGILSPNPSSLPPIPSHFFSPQSVQNSLGGGFSNLSPMLHSIGNTLFSSPSIFISPQMFSPNTQSLDIFRSLSD